MKRLLESYRVGSSFYQLFCQKWNISITNIVSQVHPKVTFYLSVTSQWYRGRGDRILYCCRNCFIYHWFIDKRIWKHALLLLLVLVFLLFWALLRRTGATSYISYIGIAIKILCNSRNDKNWRWSYWIQSSCNCISSHKVVYFSKSRRYGVYVVILSSYANWGRVA